MKKIMLLILALCLACPGLTGFAVAEEAGEAQVDLDLSRLSGTVVYAQVFNMMNDYENYLGKTIRMAGYYSYYEDLTRDVVYHACVIPDATACCAQGIEFVWGGEHAWPDDYPEEGTDILVTGRLDSYMEEDTVYLHLVDAEVTWEPEA